MSSVITLLILLIHRLSPTLTNSQCDLLSAIDLQAATYSHSIILRVQSIYSSSNEVNKVLVHEVIKTSSSTWNSIRRDDMIIIRIDPDLDESCWHLLRVINLDMILFLNQSNTHEFDLRYPPVESTLRVRLNIDAVLNYEIYSPLVIIKTPLDQPVLTKNYSLQCNARGNPLPRLYWTKNPHKPENYPSYKQCRTCRIYSIQNRYQSILYFQSFTYGDSGVYICYAENPLNQTMTSVYLDVNQTDPDNRTCVNLKSCHHRGQCVEIDNQWKCLCDKRYFGEQCEKNTEDMITKQNNEILLFKSRFLAGCLLLLLVFILISMTCISCFLVRHKQPKRQTISRFPPVTNGALAESQFIEQTRSKHSLTPPNVRVITKDSSTATDDEGDHKQWMSRKVHEKRVSLNKTSTESQTNHLILSEGYLEFYQPDAKSGLIRPLNIRTETPKRYMKYISSSNRFSLSR